MKLRNIKKAYKLIEKYRTLKFRYKSAKWAYEAGEADVKYELLPKIEQMEVKLEDLELRIKEL